MTMNDALVTFHQLENPELKLRKNKMLRFHFVINQEQEKCIKTHAN